MAHPIVNMLAQLEQDMSAWVITRDFLAEEWKEPTNAVGICSTGYAARKDECTLPARVYDDDGELYYEALIADDDDATSQCALINWARGDSGATTIKVKRGCIWKEEIG